MTNGPTPTGGGTKNPTTSKATLGLTGLTINAMALIAPGAFLWLTFQEQSLYGAPMAGCAMWVGILAALLLCFATAISYSELSKLYPGRRVVVSLRRAGVRVQDESVKFARVVKFFTGWASHLYYWVYPGLMVGVTAIFAGYMASIFWPDTFSGAYNSPLFMVLFCIVFSLGVGYIAFRGVNGTTGGQHGHQCHSDHRAGGLLRHGHLLPHAAHKEGVGYAPVQRHRHQLQGGSSM